MVVWTVTADGTWTLFRDGATQDAWTWDAAATGGVAVNPNSVAYAHSALGRSDGGSGGDYFVMRGCSNALLIVLLASSVDAHWQPTR